MSLTPARRKQLQRERDRALGWTDVTVRIAAERVKELRDFAASLPPPSTPKDPRQMDLIERIERELREEGSGDQGNLFL